MLIAQEKTQKTCVVPVTEDDSSVCRLTEGARRHRKDLFKAA